MRHTWPWFSLRVSTQCWHMAESIVISLGGGLGRLGHFGHFDCLPRFDFFNCSGGVSGLGDSSSDGDPDPKSDDDGCKWCGSKGGVIDRGLTPEPSILFSDSTSDWRHFRAMTGLGTKKKKPKKKQGQVNSGCVWIDSTNPDVLERLWKKRRKL